MSRFRVEGYRAAHGSTTRDAGGWRQGTEASVRISVEICTGSLHSECVFAMPVDRNALAAVGKSLYLNKCVFISQI